MRPTRTQQREAATALRHRLILVCAGLVAGYLLGMVRRTAHHTQAGSGSGDAVCTVHSTGRVRDSSLPRQSPYARTGPLCSPQILMETADRMFYFGHQHSIETGPGKARHSRTLRVDFRTLRTEAPDSCIAASTAHHCRAIKTTHTPRGSWGHQPASSHHPTARQHGSKVAWGRWDKHGY